MGFKHMNSVHKFGNAEDRELIRKGNKELR